MKAWMTVWPRGCPHREKQLSDEMPPCWIAKHASAVSRELISSWENGGGCGTSHYHILEEGPAYTAQEQQPEFLKLLEEGILEVAKEVRGVVVYGFAACEVVTVVV